MTRPEVTPLRVIINISNILEIFFYGSFKEPFGLHIAYHYRADRIGSVFALIRINVDLELC